MTDDGTGEVSQFRREQLKYLARMITAFLVIGAVGYGFGGDQFVHDLMQMGRFMTPW